MPPATPVDENRVNHGWVNLLIESVDVPLDGDGSLLFSTVQSLIPGAHGLYFRDNGQRRALNLDASSGKVLSPLDGWGRQDVYVHLAHGHRHGVNCGTQGEYTKASEIFERNLTAVQKLIAQTGLGLPRKPKTDAEKTDKASPKRVKPKPGFEAQPEETHVSDESEHDVHRLLAKKKKELELAAAEKEKLAERLQQAEDELQIAKKENEQLKNSLHEATSQGAPEITISPTGSSSSVDKKRKGKKGKGSDDQNQTALQQIQQELEAERHRSQDLESQLASSSTAQNQAQSMIVKLQSELDAAQKKCADWEAQAESLQTELWSEREQHDYKIQELIEKEEEMNNLHNLIADLRRKLAHAEKECSEVHSHLATAFEKISLLEKRGPKAEEYEKFALTNERVGELDQTITKLQLELTDAKEKLGQQAGKDDLIGRLYDEKDKLQWKIGELTQWWNDSKWKIGELEQSLEKQKEELKVAQNNFTQIMEESRNVTPSGINEAIVQPNTKAAFSVNRQPNSDRWQLQSYISEQQHSYGQPGPPQAPAHPQISYPAYPVPMPMPYFYPPYGYPAFPAPPQLNDTKKVLFEIEAPEAKTVFLAGSFLNWEVALLCRPLGNGRHGVSVDVPRGQYDFKFLVDGEWRASQCYHISNNEYGSLNNSRTVE
ncbi:unnamed protein product, partial [Mesorhabditis spiculigera]